MSYVGIIVAAGASSRTGLSEFTTKAALRIAGKTLLEHQIEFLRDSGIERIYVVARPQHVRLLATSTATRLLDRVSFIIADKPTGWAGEVERVLPFIGNDDEVVLLSCDNLHSAHKIHRLCDGQSYLFTYTRWHGFDRSPTNGPVFGREDEGSPWREIPGPLFRDGDLFTGYVVVEGRSLRAVLPELPLSGRGEKEIAALLAALGRKYGINGVPYPGQFVDVADLADLAKAHMGVNGFGPLHRPNREPSIGACILPYLQEANRVILAKREDGRGWVPPGGDVEPGEPYLVAARREALEEVGIDFPPAALRLVGVYPTIGKQGEPACTAVFKTLLVTPVVWNLNRAEVLQVKDFGPEDIKNLKIPFNMRDALTDFFAGRELDVR